MRFGKAATLLCVALAIVVAHAAVPVAAVTYDECMQVYTCAAQPSPYSVLYYTDNSCSCCSPTDLNNCVNAPTKCADPHCTQCAGPDSSDSPSGVCTACYQGYQPVDGACVACAVANCDECVTNAAGIVAQCRVCAAGYHWTSGVCTLNGAGSSASGESYCRGAYCDTCTSATATTCVSCLDGYKLDPATNFCVDSCTVENCDMCYSGGADCQLCSAGYTWQNKQCVQPEGCRVGHCTQCQGESFSSTAAAVDLATCTHCEDGYALSNGYCIASVACTDTNCASCIYSPDECTTCKQHYRLNAGRCEPCADPSCLYCDAAAATCTACDDNWYLTQLGSCSAVPCNLENCLMCDPANPTRCIKCVAGLIVDSDDGKCITEGTCSVANCAQCSATSAKECATCNPGYDLSADKKECTVTTTTTSTTPTPGSSSTSSTPTPTAACNVPNCAQCASGNPNSCQTCNANFYPSNGQCVRTGTCYVTNCAQCMLRDSTKCSTCKNGYLLSTSYTCISQHINVNAAAAPRSLWVAAAVLAVSAATYLV